MRKLTSIVVVQLASDGFEFVHASKALKHFVATFPKLFQLVNGSNEKATVVKVAADGKIVDKFDDPNGKVMSFVISALEFEDHLYLGSLNTNFIGKLPLKAAWCFNLGRTRFGKAETRIFDPRPVIIISSKMLNNAINYVFSCAQL